jgi:hypothetical protein
MRARGLGVVHNSRNGGFDAARIGVFVGHVWLLFVLFQLARGTRRRRNRDKKKSHPGRSGSWMDQVNQVEKVVLNAQICAIFFH